MAQFKPEQLITTIVRAHEATRNRENLGEIPKHLAVALGAAVVVMTILSVDEKRTETERATFSSNGFSIASPEEEDYTAPLVATATAGKSLTDLIQFTPNSEVHALFAIDAATLVAFRVHAPSPAFTTTDGGRALLSSLLQHVTGNLRRHAHRGNSKVREKALLRSLTRAEWRVLMALDSEMPEKQIAIELNTSSNTLHSHIKSIYRRLGVQSRLSAIALLRRAERDVLFEELQAARPADSSNNGGNSSWETRTSPSTITITPSADTLHRAVSFIPFAGTDLRAG